MRKATGPKRTLLPIRQRRIRNDVKRDMSKKVSLSEYVRRRNGVGLGDSRSMKNMFTRSFGAGSFYQFWEYWNPIWGYYLSKLVMRPLTNSLPAWLALVLTFGISGAVHDVAISLVKLRVSYFFTAWFLTMSLMVLFTSGLRIFYKHLPWSLRALINFTLIAGSFLLVTLVKVMYD